MTDSSVEESILQSRAFDESRCDTQPFEFAGNDNWGHQVRGSIVALDAADAFSLLLQRGIAAESVAEAGAAAPYRVTFAESRPSPTVGELIRGLVAKRREEFANSGYKIQSP
ncbi:MAG: hypothetical protein ABWZ77_03995 [Naasia sp.]